jgi:hypothetical protein
MPRYQLEVWNRTNTQRRAIFRALTAAPRTWKLGGEETAAFTVDGLDPALALIASASVLRLQAVGDANTFDLYRYTQKRQAENAGGATYQMQADALWMSELAIGRVAQAQADGRTAFTFGLIGLTPTAWLTFILAACASDSLTFAVGTVEPTAAVDLSFDYTSPLAAVRMLEAATQCELKFSYNAAGTICTVDLLTRVGQAAGGAELRYGKNIAGLELVEDERLTTRVYARGAGSLSLGDASWTPTGVSGTSGARALSFGAGILNPVFEDGAFVGLWYYVAAKGAYPITASSLSGRSVTVNEGALAALTTSDVGYIADTVGGRRLNYLESASARASYGIRLGEDLVADDIPDASNLVPNPDFTGVYAAGLSPGWTKLGTPTVAESTNLQFARVGGQAQRITAAAADQGVLSTAFAIGSDALRPYHGLRLGVTVLSGQVRVELRHSNGTTYPVQRQMSSAGLLVPIELTVGPLHNQPLPAGTAQVAIVAHGGAADFYADFVMVTPEIGEEVPAYVGGQGAQVLWARTAALLADAKVPKREYQIDVANLYAVDPARFPFDRLGRGDSLKVRHPRYPVETLRVVELTEDPVTVEVVKVALANNARTRPPSETDLYLPQLGASRPAPQPGPAVATRAGVLSATAQFDSGDVYITAQGNALAATLQLYTKTTRAGSYPGSPTQTIAARSGTFAPIAVATGGVLFYKIVALDGSAVPGDFLEDVYSRSDAAPPTVEPRRVFNATSTAADVYAKVESKATERIRLWVKNVESASPAIWKLCASGVDSTPLFVTTGTEIDGTTAWFHNGTSFSQVLKAIPLGRDQILRIYLQGEGENTGLKSTWTPLALEARSQPWLESVSLSWDEVADQLVATVAGGAFTQSAKIEVDDDPAFGSPMTASNQNVADGARVSATFALVSGDRGKTWYLRVTPYNGVLSAGVPTGFAGSPQFGQAAVPASEGGAGIQPPFAQVQFASGARASETVAYVGIVGAGGSTPLSMRRRIDTDVLTGSWSAPAASIANEAITRSTIWNKYVILEVTDAGGRVATSQPYVVAPQVIGLDETTGKSDPGQHIAGTFPTGVKAAADFAVGGAAKFAVGRHVDRTATKKDGDSISWASAYDSLPVVSATLGKGIAATAGNRIEVGVTGLTTTGASIRARQISGATSTSYTEYFSSTLNGTETPSGVLLLSDGAECFSSLDNANATLTTYNVKYNVNTTSLDPTDTLYVEVYYNNGASSTSWTLGGSASYGVGNNITGAIISFNAVLGANYDIRILVHSASGIGSFSVRGVQVDFSAVTGGTETALTGVGTDDYVIIEAWEAV